MTQETTHFGYKEIPVSEKTARVGEVFSSVATRYDLMNDLMSLGAHRLWKRFAIMLAAPRAGERILDLAGGTGDLAYRLAGAVGDEGLVVLSDINARMLEVGRDRMLDRGQAGRIRYVQADAERLPFAPGAFDCVTMGFGLRNVTDQQAALAAIHGVLSPGGRLVVLEFSKPVVKAVRPLYDAYSFTVLPWLGRRVAHDEHSYRYLAESIRRHPDQETLRGMMEQAGFGCCTVNNLAGGIVAVHRGYRL